ncbi:MAG: (Fe-S)-binding protein [Desulfobacteraceae bacterium]|nr:(Fe-S)-binding protein [Desulfobacteraceae bacterium]
MNTKNDTETRADQKQIHDVAIEEGARRLTREKIHSVLSELIRTEGGARLSAYSDACVHCGMCSEACHHYLSNDRDPKLSPAGKVKQTISVIMARKGKVGPDFIKKACEIAFTECNLCRRCMMYCPFGIDVAYLMLFIRRACHKLGVVPQYIQDTAHSHSATMNQMWVRDDEWIDTLQWQEEEARDEIPDIRIPIEKEGADIFYSVIGPEPKFRAQLIYQMAVIMHASGADWTMSATPGWDNSDMCMYTGDMEMTARLKKVHFEAATRLKTKRIVMGECGHAFRSVYDVGNRLLGWKMPPLPMVHAIEFYHEILQQGRIEIENKFEQPVTFHDPCNIVRGRGLHETARSVVDKTCKTFIELEPNREHNFCCGAGGGVINCGPPFKNKRVKSNSIKAEQLASAKAKGAEVVIAPCHNCHGGLEDIINHYELGMEIKFLADILYECMKKE